jgi:hypothetical protein
MFFPYYEIQWGTFLSLPYWTSLLHVTSLIILCSFSYQEPSLLTSPILKAVPYQIHFWASPYIFNSSVLQNTGPQLFVFYICFLDRFGFDFSPCLNDHLNADSSQPWPLAQTTRSLVQLPMEHFCLDIPSKSSMSKMKFLVFTSSAAFYSSFLPVSCFS